MFKTLIRPAMVFIPLISGMFFPQAHVLNNPPFSIVRFFLITMVFISSLQLHLKDLKPRREHWLVLLCNVLLGVVPYVLFLVLFPGNPVPAQAAFFTGITPTATAAPVVISFLNGRVGFALTGFAICNVCISLLLILLLPVVAGCMNPGFVWSVVQTLFWVIAFPFLTAQLVRKLWPAAAGIPKKIKMFTFLLWSFILFVLSAIARQYFLDHPGESLNQVFAIAVISFVLCVLNFRIGAMISRKRYRRECSQILGQKNTTFTMYLALQYAGPLIALGPIFYILWHNSWNAWQMYRMDMRRTKRQQKRNITQKK